MRQAEAGSRADLYEAQIEKMQFALERADQDKARLEEVPPSRAFKNGTSLLSVSVLWFRFCYT